MELRHITYFVAVAEELHFGRAAKRVHIAQPPLSQQIRQLEEELGAPLFYRTSKQVELTPAGEALLPHARTLLQQAQECAEVVRLAGKGETGTLHIGCVEEAVHFALPDLLAAYRAIHPHVKVQLIEMHSDQQLAALEAGKIDFAFGYSRAKAPDIVSQRVLKGRISLAIPASHPLAQLKSVNLSHCTDEPFIFPKRGTSPQLHDFLLSICRENDLAPRIPYTAEHIYTIMGLVRASCGITLFPEFLNQHEWPGVAFRPIHGKHHTLEMLTHYHAQRSQWPSHQSFINLLPKTNLREA